MKTSIKLLGLLAVVTLTGMASINSLLFRQYDKIDWSNPYQNFTTKALPALKHVRISGTPDFEIKLERSVSAQALLDPDLSGHLFKTEQRGDTLLVTFSTTGSGLDGPIDGESDGLVGLVLHLPELSSLYANNARVTVSGFESPQLSLTAHHARLLTEKMRIKGTLTVQTENQGFALIHADTCGTLRASLHDSSSMNLSDVRPAHLITKVAPGAELRLRGQQLGVIEPSVTTAKAARQ